MSNGNSFDQKEYTEIKSDDFIFALLKRLQQRKILLQVKVPLDPETYNSSILDVNNNPYILILDELNPKKGHKSLVDTGAIQVKATYDGLGIHFETSIAKVDESESISKYLLNFPEKLLYFQQREQFRVRVPADLKLQLRVTTSPDTSYTGRLTDLSLTGLGVNFEKEFACEQGARIKNCQLVAPDFDTLPLNIEIQYIKPDESNKSTHVGVSLFELEGEDKKQYTDMVLNIQRLSLRNLMKHDWLDKQ